MKYQSYETEREALAADVAELRRKENARAGKAGTPSMWKPAGTFEGRPHPAGVWPGPVRGNSGRRPDPILSIATSDSPVRRGKVDRRYYARKASGTTVAARDFEPLKLDAVVPVTPIKVEVTR